MNTSLINKLRVGAAGTVLAGALLAPSASAFTPVNLSFTGGATLVSGTNFADGSVYRFANGGNVGGITVDLLMTVVGRTSPVAGGLTISSIGTNSLGHIRIVAEHNLDLRNTAGDAFFVLNFQFVDSANDNPFAMSFTVQARDIDSNNNPPLDNNFSDLTGFLNPANTLLAPGTALTGTLTNVGGNFYSTFFMQAFGGQFPDVNVDPLNVAAQVPYTVGAEYDNVSQFRAIAGTTALPGFNAGQLRSSSRELTFAFDSAVPIPEPSTLALLIGLGALGTALIRRRKA